MIIYSKIKREQQPSTRYCNKYIANINFEIVNKNEAFLRADKVAKYWKMAMLSDPVLNIAKICLFQILVLN
ncbi:MAG: hypothetical protein MRQ09_06480 [Candidatus Midichloria sp.]|nr:hypothetical protein [Candidatus Midichloria sp.]